MKPIFYTMALAHPVTVGLAFFWGGPWLYATIVLSLVVYPLLELLVKPGGFKQGQVPKTDSRVPDLVVLVAGMATVSLVPVLLWTVEVGNRPMADLVLLTYSVGITTGTVGIVLSHELMHRRNVLARWLSAILLFTANYPHFRLQHIYRHHVLVGTSQDRATAKKGQSVYAFYWQSIFGGGRDLLRHEAKRARSRGYRPYSLVANRALRTWGLQVLLYLAILVMLGKAALIAFMLQGVAAIMVLETINYIQHYGLSRSKAERPDHRHAWDADSVTNYALFNLGHHAHHHAQPGKHFTELSCFEKSPKLPSGYFTSALLAMVPPIWKRIMDPRLEG